MAPLREAATLSRKKEVHYFFVDFRVVVVDDADSLASIVCIVSGDDRGHIDHGNTKRRLLVAMAFSRSLRGKRQSRRGNSGLQFALSLSLKGEKAIVRGQSRCPGSSEKRPLGGIGGEA